MSRRLVPRSVQRRSLGLATLRNGSGAARAGNARAARPLYIAQGHPVEMEGLAQWRERVWALGKEQTVAIDIEFQRQAMFGKGAGRKSKYASRSSP